MNAVRIINNLKFQKLNSIHSHYLFIQNQKIITISPHLPTSIYDHIASFGTIELKLLTTSHNNFLKEIYAIRLDDLNFWNNWMIKMSKLTGYEWKQ